MNDASSFTKLVPGFDFLQGLVKNAGAALPGIGQWVAPTIDPVELEKRIEELRTVQFWLEQNAKMLGATIQALEVQRMTLSTLKTMNVQMEGLRESLQIRMPEAAAPAPVVPPAPKAETATPPPAESESASAPAAARAPATSPGVVDPMQWWGALTKQFTELAASAMKDSSAAAPAKPPAQAAVKSARPVAAKKKAARKKPAARPR